MVKSIYILFFFEKNKKNPRKTRIGRTPPTCPPIHVFFKHLETWKQKKKSELGLDPPTHLTHLPTSEFFSDFLIFLAWQNPLVLARLYNVLTRPLIIELDKPPVPIILVFYIYLFHITSAYRYVNGVTTCPEQGIPTWMQISQTPCACY